MTRTRLTLIGLLFASIARASVDQTLDQLHDAGKDLKSLTADVSLADAGDPGMGDDVKTRRGSMVVKRGAGTTQALIRIDTKTVGKRTFEERRDVLLDGNSFVDRDYQNKKETDRKLDGKIDLFKLGQGPFPLPIGQSKEDVKAQFDVTETKPGTLQLAPRPGSQLAPKYKTITVTVDPVSGFPVQIRTIDPNDTSDTTITLSNIKTNPPVADDAFKLPAVGSDWKIVPAD